MSDKPSKLNLSQNCKLHKYLCNAHVHTRSHRHRHTYAYIYNMIKQWSIWFSIESSKNMKFCACHNKITVRQPELPILVHNVLPPVSHSRHSLIMLIKDKYENENNTVLTRRRRRRRRKRRDERTDWNCTYALLCSIAWFIRHVNSQGRTRK